MTKIKIAVLMGGNSSEYDVSVSTGQNIIKNLDQEKYDIKPVVIDKENKWHVDDKAVGIEEALKDTDVAFNAMHGQYGEDGSIQGILEFLNVPYTGSGVLASALALDKPKSRSLFRLNGLLAPGNVIISRDDWLVKRKMIEEMIEGFDMPSVIKPANLGSSIGIAIIKEKENFKKAVEMAFDHTQTILVEEFIDGLEVTCGVLDHFQGQDSAPLPVTAIYPPENRFFDYEVKYDGSTKEITPAQIEGDLTKKIQITALKAHQLLGCRGYSRTDMIIKGEKIYVLEINSLPGLSPASLLPKGAQAAGLDFSQLLDHIINTAAFDKK